MFVPLKTGSTIIVFKPTAADITGTLPSYTGLDAGYLISTKNMSTTQEIEITSNGSEKLDESTDNVKLQPLSALDFVYVDGTYGWIIK